MTTNCGSSQNGRISRCIEPFLTILGSFERWEWALSNDPRIVKNGSRTLCAMSSGWSYACCYWGIVIQVERNRCWPLAHNNVIGRPLKKQGGSRGLSRSVIISLIEGMWFEEAREVNENIYYIREILNLFLDQKKQLNQIEYEQRRFRKRNGGV